MKKLLLPMMLFASTFISAQLPDYGVLSENIIITDIDGNQHDLYAILDEGKPVVLDLFAEWCGPCWNYHNTGTSHPNGGALKTLYNQYGPDGTNELMVFAVETDNSTPASDMNGGAGTNGWDWVTGVPYPMANQNIGGIFNQTAYPTIVLICPDRTVTELGQGSAAQIYAASQACEAAPSQTNDPRLISYASDDYFCQGGSAEVKAVLQNFGSQTLTSATIELLDGQTAVLTENWNGSLDQFEAVEVSLGTVTPTEAKNYTLRITSANDNTNNDEITNITVSPAPILEVGSSDRKVNLDITMDNYASELGIIFNEGLVPSNQSPVQIHNAAAQNPNSVLGFVQVGSLADGTNTFEWSWTVNNEGCHHLVLVDAFSDGINYNTPNATIEVSGTGDSKINVAPDFGSSAILLFEVALVDNVGLTSVSLENNLVVYPNPATNNVTIDFEGVLEDDATLSIINVQGQEVHTQIINQTNYPSSTSVDLSGFESGVYLINLTVGQVTTTKRLSIVK